MQIAKFSPSLFGLAAAALVGAWAAPAAADQCSEDGDCPKGFTCETSGAVACPEIDCADGEECDKPADCATEEVRQCVSIDCSADSDCADGMLCQTVTTEECAGSGGGASTPGDPGSDGDADPAPDAPDGAEPAPEPEPVPADESCVTEERNYCVYRYELPCESATDCGSGFTCETRDTCVCTSPAPGDSDMGGGDTPDDDGSDSERPAAPPIDPDAEGEADDAEDGGSDDCGCPADSSVGYCELEITGCATDADCPAGLTCQENGLANCSSTPDGGTDCVTDPEMICTPPYSGSVPVYGYDVEESRGDSGGGEEDPTDPANPDPPATDDNEVDEDLAADGSSEGNSGSGGGCAVGSGSALPTSTWASLVLMLGAAAMRRRRRA